MTNRPWMPLYIGDYLADTGHLSATEHGAYLLLLMHQWQTGTLPADDVSLCRIARVHPPHWPRIRERLAPFFGNPKTGVSWYQKRLGLEYNKAVEISQKRAKAAMQMHSKSSANALQMHTHSQSQKKKDARARARGAPAASENGEAVTPVVWITGDDFRFAQLAEKYRQDHNGRPPPLIGGQGGMGYYFLKSWVDDVGNAERRT